MSTIAASTTTTTGFKVTSDTTGTLVLQTGATPTTAMTIDGSQNVGVGVTPSAWGSSYKAIQITPRVGLFGNTSDTILGNNLYNDGTNWKYIATATGSLYLQGSGINAWYTAASGTAGSTASLTQAMTLDASGNLLVGITTYVATNANYLALQTSGGNLVTGHASGTPSGYQYAAYLYAGGLIGSITQNGTTGVLFNVMSDYRLKNNQEDLTGAKDFIMALKPKKWQWWDGSGEGVGFIAHEFMEVAKYSGHGEKDAVETIEIKDKDGNVTGTEERPIYQSIQPSSSEVMANLVSLIQEQQAIIQAQAADIAALKAKVGI